MTTHTVSLNLTAPLKTTSRSFNLSFHTLLPSFHICCLEREKSAFGKLHISPVRARPLPRHEPSWSTPMKKTAAKNSVASQERALRKRINNSCGKIPPLAQTFNGFWRKSKGENEGNSQHAMSCLQMHSIYSIHIYLNYVVTLLHILNKRVYFGDVLGLNSLTNFTKKCHNTKNITIHKEMKSEKFCILKINCQNDISR